jgi:transglutaminase-like putative cysteine protease
VRTFDRFIVRLVGRNGQEAASCEMHRYGRRYLPTGGISDGEYSLEVFNLTDEYGRFRSYVQNSEAIIRAANGNPSFSEPLCLRSNNAIIRRFSHSQMTIRQLLSPDESYPSNHPDVRRLAASITAGIHDEYGKLLAVHDWVAENIFYDYDSLRRSGSRIVALERSTINVLRTRRAVCQGYSDLAVSLLRACGIPSVSVGCFALGESSTGGWERAENRNGAPNHAFTTALILGRYVLMDITWDSDNEYSDGRYKHKTGYGKSRKFFDVSAQLFSASHRLVLPSDYR